MKNQHHHRHHQVGFTLIEVLLALAIIAIALTAILKVTAQNVANTARIKDKTISHWIALQGVTMVQLGLLTPSLSQETTQVTTMLGQRWYWRVKLNQTPMKTVQEISIKVSKNQAGPFTEALTAFRYFHEQQ
ncbi:general secretion pathway protein I [Legionella beliardensis]|uniref:Type II secretion system protein I n=1 Tax=Legionella beliardensis TaxID=91822 RepID=A0A378I1C8_9GAMM|nr:type II secretion system minor pseudopilin GspI [Legionella beliardensis]STX29017.1 general secretion pathway protein I [Legionella beliardensis]